MDRKEKLESKGITPAFVGPVPGIGTKIALVKPDDGVPVVFVDYGDFEKEQPEERVIPISQEIEELVQAVKKLD